MTLALLAAAGAALVWPDARAVLRSRLPGMFPSGRRRSPSRVEPLAAGALAGGLAAVVSTPLVAVLAAGCAVLAARNRRSRRAEAAAVARLGVLAEALAALAAELRAGRPPGEAVRGAADACPDRECGAALVRAVRAAGTGGAALPRDDGTDDALARLSAAAALSARTGCSLAAVVAAVEDDLRARIRQSRDLLVATAGPRSSARLLAGLPLLGMAMGSGVGAEPWTVLTTTGAGQGLLVAGVLLEIAGIAWTGRLVRRIGR